ncbi:potassium channel family protein [Candidatus Gracilibacteria bacterium]|nr:potassium channel family protein [Candidatus Gracilibacteria bacterium]MCF7896801.1 potassium channel family protein [Candidatus Gracilibacteria bacterium]
MEKNTLQLLEKDSVFQNISDESSSDSSMNLHEAMHFIEGREVDDRFAEARKTLKKRLQETLEDEERGTCNYYLLRLMLREHLLFENKEARDIYQKMQLNFLTAERNYRKEFFKMKRGEEKKVLRSQIEAFYRLIDSYLVVLEKIYQKKGFLEGSERAYEDKMHFRKSFAFFSGKHFAHLGHVFLDKTSRYGHSLGRWGFTVLLFISFFAGIYALLDLVSPTSMFADYVNRSGFFDYFYFSTVTFTTLGYGDITPITIAEKLIAGIEVLLGFTMLGIFINLIKRRFG